MAVVARNSRAVTAIVGLSLAVSTHAFQSSGYCPAPRPHVATLSDRLTCLSHVCRTY